MGRLINTDDLRNIIMQERHRFGVLSVEISKQFVDIIDFTPTAEQTNTAELSDKKICDTCKHNPPSKKFPCVDCDMRTHDRFEKQTNTAEMILEQVEQARKELQFAVKYATDSQEKDHYQRALNLLKSNSNTAEWIENGKQGGIPISYRCSNCDFGWTNNKFKYCPNCGSTMRKGE